MDAHLVRDPYVRSESPSDESDKTSSASQLKDVLAPQRALAGNVASQDLPSRRSHPEERRRKGARTNLARRPCDTPASRRRVHGEFDRDGWGDSWVGRGMERQLDGLIADGGRLEGDQTRGGVIVRVVLA